MLSRIDYIPEQELLYVIAFNCGNGQSFASFVPQLKRFNIECIDVIACDEDVDFELYLSIEGAYGNLPLLFIFSAEEMLLVRNYQELADATARMAA